MHGLSNRAPPHTLNTSITLNNKMATTPKRIANCFIKQFTTHTRQTDPLTTKCKPLDTMQAHPQPSQNLSRDSIK